MRFSNGLNLDILRHCLSSTGETIFFFKEMIFIPYILTSTKHTLLLSLLTSTKDSILLLSDHSPSEAE